MLVLILVLVICGAAILIGFGIYLYAFYSPNRKQNDDLAIKTAVPTEEMKAESVRLIKQLQALPFEAVSIRSYDGLRLAGRYYHSGDGRPLAILCHGYRGTPTRDFCGGADSCLSMGYNVLMIEQRAHCSSQGHSITFGVKERLDCAAWADYAAARFGPDQKIVLVGISMGAATVLMASALKLPSNVKGIIADCPYTNPDAIIRRVASGFGLPLSVIWPFVVIASRLFARFSMKAADAAEAVKATKVPILLIHGEDDRLVPCEMSRQIAAANPSMIEFHTFPDAWHGISYLFDTPRYNTLIRSFCARIFA